MHSFLVALAFLTIIPIRFREMPSPAVVARSRFWYPVVGLLLGALLGGWTMLASWLGSPPLAAFLVLALWVCVTGALHLDGFCDLCDGLFGGRTPEDSLRIMKDPHLGTFGLVGGVLLLLGKFVAIQELLAHGADGAPWVLGCAILVGRCLVLTVAAGMRYPRPEGTAKVLIEAAAPWEGIVFLLCAVLAVLVLSLVLDARRCWLVLLAAIGAVLILKQICRSRLGGITGDCLGAAIESAELVFVLGAASAGSSG